MSLTKSYLDKTQDTPRELVNDETDLDNLQSLEVNQLIRMATSPVRSLCDYLRLRKIFKNPFWVLAVCRYAGPAKLAKLSLQNGNNLWVRAGTVDVAVVRSVFILDEYNLNTLKSVFLPWVVDIGSHIGTFIVKIAPQSGRILSFEPDLDNLSVLRMNLRENLPEKVTSYPVAVSGHSGKLRLFKGQSNVMHSMIPANTVNKNQYHDTACIRLQEALQKHNITHIDLLKIDCEGAEYEILSSLVEWGLDRIDRIVMEYHPVKNLEPPFDSPISIVKYLRDSGFRVTLMTKGHKNGFGIIHATRKNKFASD